jgi:cellulose synthase/poly-beta-1,6-N-acetylglucosamine synthase-like glycosyltransferase
MPWTDHDVPQPLRRSGVFIKNTNGKYAVEPKMMDQNILNAVRSINAMVVVAIVTDDTELVLDTLQADKPLGLKDGSQIQTFESLEVLAHSKSIKKLQYAALVRQERLLLVWYHDLSSILERAMYIHGRIQDLVITLGHDSSEGYESTLRSQGASPTPYHRDSQYTSYRGESNIEPREEVFEMATVDYRESETHSRPVIYTSACFTALGVFLMSTLVLGYGNSAIVSQINQDHFYPRILLVLSEPIFFCLGLFFVIVFFNNIFQVVGPTSYLKTNSRFYSATKPDLAKADGVEFKPPPITIQMPIYTESLQGVVKRSVASLQKAISYYELRGGSARIFINDDGMAMRSDAENAEFEDFYASNNIGWVARPKHNASGFVRPGKFKKASNMNYALNFSLHVDDALCKLVDRLHSPITADEETELYERTMAQVLESDPRTKAGGDIRMGSIILLVDSDTEVPEDCLMYGAAEMFLSPEVAIIQHSTGVMQVSWDWFEHAVAYFTNLVYSSIRFAVGSGEAAPFVGHNAFIRWSAVQDVAMNGPRVSQDVTGLSEEGVNASKVSQQVSSGGYIRFWSENNVSEDFDMAIRLQIDGYIIRLASYHSGEFKEGISLSIFDELDRWEKYAYGCSELIFHPLMDWFKKGPITPLFRKFLGKLLSQEGLLELTVSRLKNAALIEDDHHWIHLIILRSRICCSSWSSELLPDRMEEWRHRLVLR